MEQSVKIDARPSRYATRLPIHATDGTVFGYTLIFRTDVVDHFSDFLGIDSASAAIEMSTLLALDVLCNNRPAFILCDGNVLLQHGLELLPADKVVVGIESSVVADDAIYQLCYELKNSGYKIALSDYSPNDPRQSIAHLADFIFVDLRHTSRPDIALILDATRGHLCSFIATGVETRGEIEFAKGAGFHFLQGSIFLKPESMKIRSTSANRIVYLRLLSAVSQPKLDWYAIEELIKSDVTIYYRLMRFINSAAFGNRSEVRSVLQALSLLGEDEIRCWCRIAGIFEMSRRGPSEAVLSALIRARSLELLGKRIDHGETDLFLVGLLTLMETILEVPMAAILEGLCLEKSVLDLLLNHAGPLQTLLDMVFAVESGAWNTVTETCAHLCIEEEFAAECYSNAITWAQSLAAAI